MIQKILDFLIKVFTDTRIDHHYDEPPLPVVIYPEKEPLNKNPDLNLGVCNQVMFETEEYGQEFITQCIPARYSLHTEGGGERIRVEHTGNAYSIRPLNNYGKIGFTIPRLTLHPAKYLVELTGFAHLWGEPDHYAIRADYSIDGVDGTVDLGGMPLRANGEFLARFELPISKIGNYNINVYLLIVHPSLTGDSFITFNTLKVLEE